MSKKPQNKSEAIEQGYIPESDLRKHHSIPRKGAAPLVIRKLNYYRPSQLKTAYHMEDVLSKPFLPLKFNIIAKKNAQPELSFKEGSYFSKRQVEDIESKSAWQSKGFKPKANAASCGYQRRYAGGRYRDASMYRQSDIERVKKRAIAPAKQIDLLDAIFVVNRSAKRCRDAAQKAYRCGDHGTAKRMRLKKEDCYRLKDRGIASAIQLGRIVFCRCIGGLAEYRGDGFCFHSRWVPESKTDGSDDAEENDNLFVESKPRGRKEARIMDGIYTLENLPEIEELEGFTKTVRPAIHKPKSRFICEDCGKHFSAEWAERGDFGGFICGECAEVSWEE